MLVNGTGLAGAFCLNDGSLPCALGVSRHGSAGNETTKTK